MKLIAICYHQGVLSEYVWLTPRGTCVASSHRDAAYTWTPFGCGLPPAAMLAKYLAEGFEVKSLMCKRRLHA